ncbi:MAG: hypothetical protein EBR82_64570 [Caulobacteraceae bacterium]|nr:hypothetical protein [Caulobacteraceae bacterium]
MKRIAILLVCTAIAASAAEEAVIVSETLIQPPAYTESVQIRPRRIVIEYADDSDVNPTVSAIYERLVLRTIETNEPTIISRENARIVALPWASATNKVPALATAREQFAAVFRAIFTGTNAP